MKLFLFSESDPGKMAETLFLFTQDALLQPLALQLRRVSKQVLPAGALILDPMCRVQLPVGTLIIDTRLVLLADFK